MVYFAPHIMEFQRLGPVTDESSPDLISRVGRWKNLNYIRVGIFLAVSKG